MDKKRQRFGPFALFGVISRQTAVRTACFAAVLLFTYRLTVHAASPCDLNNDVLTNVSDVQLCANQAIGVSACSNGDIDLDGTCNVIDVQRVVNTALGGQCVTPSTTPARGPQASITCPAGSVNIFPGTNIQTVVDANPAGTSFCLKTGIHSITYPTVPRSGNTFTGEYNAILDGSNWSTTDEAAGAFMCYGGMNITHIAIRNLTIRKMPKKGIHDRDTCLHWTVENNEVHDTQVGVVLTAGFILRNNKLHHNGYGLTGWAAANYAFISTSNYPNLLNLVENNEISYGGDQQKGINSGPITWRGNWIHHNQWVGLWNDGEGNGSIIENNIVEDNPGPGIFIEGSVGITVRNNTIRRNGDQAIFVSTTRDSLIHNNIMEGNFRGVTLYLTCLTLSQGWPWNPDLANNTIRDNETIVPATSGSLASAFSYSGDCTSAQLVPYLNNTKNNRFQNNRYTVPDVPGWYWLWAGGTLLRWNEWQAIPQDVTGTVEVR